MSLPRIAGLVEHLMGLAGGQALVPQVNGQAGQRAQFGGEGPRLHGLRAYFAGEMQRIPDNNAGHTKPPGEPRNRAEIVALIAPPLESQHRLRRQAQFVGHGDADAPVAEVESEIARWVCSLQMQSFPIEE